MCQSIAIPSIAGTMAGAAVRACHHIRPGLVINATLVVIAKPSVAMRDIAGVAGLDYDLGWLLHELGLGATACVDIGNRGIGAQALFSVWQGANA